MGTGRWRLKSSNKLDQLPMVWHPPVRLNQSQGMEPPNEMAKIMLVSALKLLANRGEGPFAWAAPFYQDPIAFLLDTSSDAINLWGSSGELLYCNRSAERLGTRRCEGRAWEVFIFEGRRYERRCCPIRYGNAEYLLEVIGHRGEPPVGDSG